MNLALEQAQKVRGTTFPNPAVGAVLVKGNKVQVWSEEVSEPLAVRYGWSNLPLGGLMNGRELPAYPFRSDNWPMVPHQSAGAYEVDEY